MKELTIEQKAQRYDEALDRAKKLYEQGTITECLGHVFPELKESEDEKMRRWIINYLDNKALNSGIIQEKTNIKNAIAWLEKQGEHNNFIDKIQVGDKVTRNEDGMLVNLSQLDRVAKKDEKQGGQRSDIGISSTTKQKLKDNLNKALQKETCDSWNEFLDEQNPMTGSKFKVGDKVVHKGTGKTWTVHWYIKEDNTYSVEDSEGLINIYSPDVLEPIEQKSADKVEPKFHEGDIMRTLEEAKEGITNGLPVVVSIDEEYYHCNNEIISIKDQDDYEFPPINMKKKPAWSEEDNTFFKAIIRDIENTQYISEDAKKDRINWLKSIKDRVQPKQEWSEEDENRFNNLIFLVECSKEGEVTKQGFIKFINRIKSLRPQPQFKPSDEQMKALAEALSLAKNCGEESAFDLRTLYEQLKKLREDRLWS